MTSVNAELHHREHERAECACGRAATEARVVRGIRQELCERCAELCDESRGEQR